MQCMNQVLLLQWTEIIKICAEFEKKNVNKHHIRTVGVQGITVKFIWAAEAVNHVE